MVVDLKKVSLSRISAGLCIIAVDSLWHNAYPSINADVDMRTIHRSCGDDFLQNYLTAKGYGPDDFHFGRGIRGKGLYDLIRETSASLLAFLPRAGQNRTLDFPPGVFLNVLGYLTN